MKALGIASLVAGFALATSAHAATNLLTNGSFETGDFTGWSLAGVAGDSDEAAVIFYNNAGSYPDGAYGEAVPPDSSASLSPDAVGDRAAYFVSDFSTETLSQTVFLTAGLYNVGFSAYAPANGYSNAVDALFSATIAGVQLTPVGYTVSDGPAVTWQHFTGVANILVSGNYTATFSFLTDGYPAKDIVIDRAYISAVPEPATWGLMITGFGLAGAALRRRRRAVAATA